MFNVTLVDISKLPRYCTFVPQGDLTMDSLEHHDTSDNIHVLYIVLIVSTSMVKYF